ncbi:RNA degradosome polyphosphate kinase [Mammaliicoccus stepanovicii]|uniref:Polyphosphate kinase n=1 Tax=Mammaliicoccus stepanovicii TaxID=643214 RepID=A0A239YVW7_9STAP|nr:RNA degradosome polyphosphate kinase [Mammaliicoccus stepanovicii]PNZ75594.1 RNA degradosome polyphosphate kinase [Mammaliicoccus stepanovicii]GGI40635.1 polyphosphate kinase [Mammaliicoccus stepanovicii]SNV62890.1 polyphosphate kinase [Mammaliicoccus stepanovicii]
MEANIQKYNLDNPAFYNNRELSWLDFNYRVLEEALDPNNPLLEQLKFLAIHSSNLDEFFMVRVAGLKDQVKMGFNERENKAQLTPTEQLVGIEQKNRENVELQYKRFNELKEQLKSYNIFITQPERLNDTLINQLNEQFNLEILPTLSPLGIDAYRPFPKLNNKMLNLFVDIQLTDGEIKSAIVPVPTLLERIIKLEHEGNKYIVFLEDVILYFIDQLFNGFEVINTYTFRVTRNADLTIHEDGAEDLLIEIERFLKERKSGAAVRLEIDSRHINADVKSLFLMNEIEITEKDIYRVNGPLDLTVLFSLVGQLEDLFPELLYKPYTPQVPQALSDHNIFDLALKKDIFFHHPYESFMPIVDFIREASEDPDTLAIKQTLYRVSSDSPIIEALKNAAENGKQVTVLVELKARFDEENNVQWAKRLEDAGCNVIYGMTFLKTHSKITLVIKKVQGKVTTYVHLGTGNYNDKTAKIYTDMGIITTNPKIGEDAINFFNYLSGYSLKPEYNELIVAPFEIRDFFVELLDQEIQSHKKHGNGLIIAKMNSLTDKKVINKLFEASQCGVKIKLIIRGICCLKPGIKGVSENIDVISIVGRFLEHSRIYYFHHNGDEKMYLSSADMMTRNMIKRVEILFPVLDQEYVKRLMSYLNLQLNDGLKGRIQNSNGIYEYNQSGNKEINSQDMLMKEAMTFTKFEMNNQIKIGKPMTSKRNSMFNRFKKKFKK